VFNKTASRKNDGRKNSREHKPESEIIRIPGGVPAIVSEELFAKANEKMEFRKRVRCDLDSKYKFLLTGIVFCECGSSMTSNVHHNGSGKAYPNYRCSKKGNSYSCKAKEINSKMLESFVVSELRKFLYNEAAIKEITKEINETMKKRIQEQKDSVDRLKKELSKLRVSQKNVLDAIVSTGISPALREKLDEVEKEIAFRESQIHDAEKISSSYIPVNYAAVKSCIKDMKNVLKKSDYLSIKRLIFDFVERVTVYSDHVEVIFKLPVPLNPELVKPALCKTVSKTTDNIIINHSA
jgi:site-specific DNA recombinase